MKQILFIDKDTRKIYNSLGSILCCINNELLNFFSVINYDPLYELITCM